VSQNLRKGERRNVTVLFADMKDFTALSAKFDPEEVDSLMNRVFSTFETIIRRYGGAVEKYIGDALVAVFGVPHMHEDDPERCVNSALDFLREVERLNRAPASGGLTIAFRIGINSGLITTGKRGDHDVITGHAMSVASRLESSAAENSVFLSESTKALCSDDFAFSEPVVISAKGTDSPIRAYAVTGRAQSPSAGDSPFVGRKEILDRILKHYLRHDSGSVDGFLITGSAGMGKTRLATELIEKIRRLPDFDSVVMHARARRYRGGPFAAITDLMASHFAVRTDMSVDEIAKRVHETIDTEPKTAEGFARLAVGEFEENENQAFVLLYLIMKTIIGSTTASPYPPAVFVDNPHFMDKGSKDFLQFYVKNADAVPFFLLTDRGPEETDGLAAQLKQLELPPLERQEGVELIRAVSKRELDQQVIASILENSRGNPLFIREYARFASENRDIQALPATIQNIFLTSIDSQEPETRDFLKRMSVFVHSFSREDALHLQTITDGDPQIVDESLEQFVRDGTLIREGELYMFRHDVFRTAVYNSILNYNKRILHRVIADLMETKSSPHPLRLLHHLCRAGETDRAYSALTSLPNTTTGIDYLRYVDRLLDSIGTGSSERRMNLTFLKSAILFRNGMVDQADSLLKEMMTTAVNEQNALYAGSAYHLLAETYLHSFSFGKADFCGRKARAYYRSVGRAAFSTQGLLEILASSALLQNHREQSAALTQEIAELEATDDEVFSRERLTSIKAEHHLMRGEYARARELLLKVLGDQGGTRPDGSALSIDENWYSIRYQLGIACFHLCSWNELRTFETIALDSPSKNLSNISQTNARLGIAHHFLGEAEEAARRLQIAEFTASQIRNDYDLVGALRTLSECQLLAGDLKKADSTARSGISIGLRHAATYPVLTLLMVLVEMAAIEEDSDRARFFLNEADLLLESGMLVRPRDVMLYHYYRSALADGSPEESRKAATDTLERELTELAEPGRIEAFLQTRRYGTIYAELIGTGAGGEREP
jgi:class 3 adenylate cyclase